ncbi:MAG: hypothetical protein H6855_02225 [Rhodospirillales bacterium]|nr:hypothetical protein [Rhodospirillales bacterium]MCB9980582.1 hypothetical protein [Rhodospirillales bacterium]
MPLSSFAESLKGSGSSVILTAALTIGGPFAHAGGLPEGTQPPAPVEHVVFYPASNFGNLSGTPNRAKTEIVKDGNYNPSAPSYDPAQLMDPDWEVLKPIAQEIVEYQERERGLWDRLFSPPKEHVSLEDLMDFGKNAPNGSEAWELRSRFLLAFNFTARPAYLGTHCYSYSTQVYHNPEGPLDPGEAAGFPSLKPEDMTAEEITRRVLADGKDQGVTLVTGDDLQQKKEGFYKVLLFLDQGGDYHFVQENQTGFSYQTSRSDGSSIKRVEDSSQPDGVLRDANALKSVVFTYGDLEYTYSGNAFWIPEGGLKLSRKSPDSTLDLKTSLSPQQRPLL